VFLCEDISKIGKLLNDQHGVSPGCHEVIGIGFTLVKQGMPEPNGIAPENT
jgi:hypothetical protein